MTNLARTAGHFALRPWPLFILLFACAPLIGPHSPTAYENATSLKAATLALMDKAAEPYADHAVSVDALMVEIDKAYEFVKGVPANNLSSQQWMILKKPDGDLLGKFFLRWKERGTLAPEFIGEFKALVAGAFDEIICLEANKKEATGCRQQGGSGR
jgi:hypothetical protein